MTDLNDIDDLASELGISKYNRPLAQQLEATGEKDEIDAKLLAAQAVGHRPRTLTAWLKKVYGVTISPDTLARYLRSHNG